MACNCKNKQKQILGPTGFVDDENPQTLWEKIKHYTKRTVHTIIVAVLFIILTPLVIVGVIYNYAVKGNLMVTLPSFITAAAKKADKKLKEPNG